MTKDPGSISSNAPQDPSLSDHPESVEDKNSGCVIHLTTSMSPLKLSLTSRTKKSVFGPPIPVLTTDIGTPLYRPVIVVKPLSDVSLNGTGLASRCLAIIKALEGEPTAIYNAKMSQNYQNLTDITYNPICHFPRLQTEMIYSTISGSRKV